MPTTRWIIGTGVDAWLPWRVQHVDNFFIDPGSPATSNLQGYWGPADLDTMVDIVYRTKTWKIVVDLETVNGGPLSDNGTYSMDSWGFSNRGTMNPPGIPDETHINGADLGSGRSPLTRFLTGSNFNIELFQFPTGPGPQPQLGPIIFRPNGATDGQNRPSGYYIRGEFSVEAFIIQLFTAWAPNDTDTYRAAPLASILIKTKRGASLPCPLGTFKFISDTDLIQGKVEIIQDKVWPYTGPFGDTYNISSGATLVDPFVNQFPN